MKIAINLIVFTLVIRNASGQCSLCPGGSGNIEDTAFKLYELAKSCGDIDGELAIVADSECQAELVNANKEFDFSAACCSDVEVSTINCAACPEGQWMYNPALLIPNKELTCGETEEISNYVIDGSSFTCKLFRDQTRLNCCGNEDGFRGECTLCPLEGMTSGSKIIPGSTTSCETYNSDLMMILPGSGCTAAKADKVGINYDIQAFCGCNGVDPADTCQFCTGEQKLGDPTTEVPGSGGAVCGDFERLASFIDANACAMYEQTCCVAITDPPTPAAVEDSTEAPTAAPTAAPTDGSSQMHSFVSLVSFSVITLFFQFYY